jgi:hypothetical protein
VNCPNRRQSIEMTPGIRIKYRIKLYRLIRVSVGFVEDFRWRIAYYGELGMATRRWRWLSSGDMRFCLNGILERYKSVFQFSDISRINL